MEGYPYKSTNGLDMEPVAAMYHNITIHYIRQTLYRKVIFLEPIAPFQCLDLGAQAAGATSPLTNIPNLEMYDGELGQWRWYPLDNAQVRIYLPSTGSKQDLKNLQPPIDPTIINTNPSLNQTEFFVWQDNRPAVQSIAGLALNAVRIIAKGYRFMTVELYPHTWEEKQMVKRLAGEKTMAGPLTSSQMKDLMVELVAERRVASVDVWASALGASVTRG